MLFIRLNDWKTKRRNDRTRSVVNLVLNSEILEINENNRVAQFSQTLRFDAATFEIWERY